VQDRPLSRIAYVFPGQGSQSVGMAQAVLAASPAATAVVDEADRALGEPVSRLMADGPEETLNLTENAQPALLAASIAYLAAARERWAQDGTDMEPSFMAGHSMGQYSAMVAAGALSLADGVRLVRTRGRLMQESGSGRAGAMAAIIGLDDAALPALVERASAHGTFGVANRNAPGQVVVSGERAAIDAAAEISRELGAKRAIVLPVSVAAHSPLMAEAAEGMRAALADVTFTDPAVPLLANADGRPLTSAEDCRRELVEHLTTGVDWVGVVGRMAASGITTFIEVGPGKVLTNLIKRIDPEATAQALDDAAAPGGLSINVGALPV
jgi:[acyl-carrier-protein] S-malonyltransferase